MSISGTALRCRDESDAGQALGLRVDAIVVRGSVLQLRSPMIVLRTPRMDQNFDRLG